MTNNTTGEAVEDLYLPRKRLCELLSVMLAGIFMERDIAKQRKNARYTQEEFFTS